VGQFSQTAEAMGRKGIAAVVGGCPPILIGASKSPLYFKKEKCRDVSRRVGFMLTNRGVPHVVIAARWVYYTDGALDDPGNTTNRFSSGNAIKDRELFYASLRGTVDAIVKSGRTVTLIGPVPELPFHLPNAMMKAMMRNEPIDPKRPYRFNQPFKEFADRQQLVFEKLSEFDQLPGVDVVYPHKLLCDDSVCKTTIDGKPLYFDDDHLGSFGAAYVEPAIQKALATTPDVRPIP
jgi:SGNH domain (fused to AT3 domains)